MPKTRVQKEAILARTTDRLSRSQSVVLVNVQSVKVGDLESIRDSLFSDGLQLQIAQNNILKKALADAGIEVPEEALGQPLGLVFSYDDAVAGAKLVAPFLKEVENLEVVGGIMDGVYLSQAQVIALSKLPSREQLLGQLVGTLAAPISGMVNVLQGNIRGLVTVMGQIRDSRA
ncbi:MAG: 50S ribosomal protein L10 [bacterium]